MFLVLLFLFRDKGGEEAWEGGLIDGPWSHDLGAWGVVCLCSSVSGMAGGWAISRFLR
jgi:hypothetical protein